MLTASTTTVNLKLTFGSTRSAIDCSFGNAPKRIVLNPVELWVSFGRIAAARKSVPMMEETENSIGQQQRQWSRIRVAIPMFVRGTDQRGKEFLDFATALNISPGGALLVLKRNLHTGAELMLEIPIGVVPETLSPKVVRSIRAQLLRLEPVERFFLAGVKFPELLSI